MAACEVCNGLGDYPIITITGRTLYYIRCPECHGISDEELERKCAEDRAVLEKALGNGQR
jgi:hypothetical protein